MQALLRSTPNSTVFLDREGRVDFCSDSWLTLVGLKDDSEIKGRYFWDVMRSFENGKYSDAIKSIFSEIRVSLNVRKADFHITFPGADTRLFEVHFTPLLDEEGNFDGAQLISFDSVQFFISEADKRVKIMFDSTPMAVQFWDQDFNLLDCNAEAVRLFGMSSKTEYLNRFHELNPEFQPDGESSSEKLKKYIRMAFETGYQRFEWESRLLSNEPLPTELILVRTPWKDESRLVIYINDIRRVKAKESAMQEAEERTRLLLNGLPIACLLFDEKGVLIDCNDAALKMSSISKKEEYIGKWTRFTPEFQSDGERSADKSARYNAAAMENGFEHFEWTSIDINGAPIPTETNLVRVPWKNGHLLAAYSRDLREIRAREAEAREAEERVSAMLDSLSIGCTFWDADGKLLDCNKTAVEMFHCRDKQEYLDGFYKYLLISKFSKESSVEKALRAIHETIKKGDFHSVWECETADGKPLPVKAYLKRIPWKDGVRVVGYFTELRELLETQDNLTRIRSIVEGSPHLVMYVNSRGDIEYMNPAVSTVTGYSREEFAISGFNLIFDKKNIQYFRREVILKTIKEQSQTFDTRIKCKDGRWLDLLVSTYAAVLHTGEAGVGVIARDITEFKRMQAEIVKSKEETERALAKAELYNKARTDFLSRMSHEMRTPMNTVIGMTEVARIASNETSRSASYEKIYGASKQLLDIINGVLDMAKIDAGEFVLTPHRFRFFIALQSLIDSAVAEAKKKNQAFTIDVDGSIPEFLITDERRLKLAVSNILSNAVKFAPENGKVSFSVRRLPDDGQKCVLCFKVCNTGNGILEKDKQRIFRAFEQVDNTIKREYGGAGLGLPIAAHIAKLMDGGIEVESTPGKGACFTCTVKSDYTPSGSFLTPHLSSTEYTNLTGTRILVVDDIETNREIVIALLEDTGAIIDAADSGKKALAAISQNRYDFILMDLHMPNMDGFEATKLIRKLEKKWGRRIPIVALTADSGADVRRRCFESGMDDFMHKPVEYTVLLQMLSHYLKYRERM
ncbi:MAG: PAS domain-containing protein [Treponema sp.]|jgi:PAS domain S-box-containing protein|nr:PAS domain-containing protein [Treponema sp.]